MPKQQQQPGGGVSGERSVAVERAFEQFFTAVTCKAILASFHQLLDVTGLRHADHAQLYGRLKEQLKASWKAQSLWAKLDKRASHRDYGHGKICSHTKVLIIGSGPCGLRIAIECALLGARTVIVEKRDRFSRNNVLHLWPYLITDLKNLGAKMFFGKFCAGAIDHISIRQLQCILLKVALLVGVEVHVNVGFEGLIEPPEDQSLNQGWRCKCDPENHPVSEYQFDVLIGADGKRNTLSGFKRKEFRGKLAIAITANFINRNSQAEASVEEISGVAFIFNQKFFTDLKDKTGIDLENIVYYKDDTHYFVMTAKKQSLLDKGVLKKDHADTIALLDRSNVNQEALMSYAREAADFSTNQQLPSLEYAVNHYGQADVAMFDFTSMFVSENASRIREKYGHRLLMGLVGDSLLEPFWPTGSGCARGFLGAFDAAWMIRSWAGGRMTPLQIIAERESIYTLLSQTTPNRLHKNSHQYSIDPNTRYPNLSTSCVKPFQVVHLYDGVVDPKELEEQPAEVPAKRPRNVVTNEYNVDSYNLLRWCQRVLNMGIYRGVHVIDFTSSWRSGLAFCALIHAFRPHLINSNSLIESEVAKNNQLAFDVAQKELGIAPVMTGEDMASCAVPDKLTMVAYLSQFHELFKHEPLPCTVALRPKSKHGKEEKVKTPRSPSRKVSLLSRIGARISKSKKRKEEAEGVHLGSKKLKDELDSQAKSCELMRYSKLPMEEIANRLQVDMGAPGSATGVRKDSKVLGDAGSVSVTAMAEVLVAKFKCNEEQPAPPPVRRLKGQPSLLAAQSVSEFCYFCQKRVYIMERQGAEGVFFHRHCLKCDFCGVGLRLNNYSCERPQGEGVKFYCYRHFTPEMRIRPRRKRNLDAVIDSKENIPATVVTPPEETEAQLKEEQTTPKKRIPAPLQVPGDVAEKAKKTPERIEFEISFDGQEEESEEEQFEHNLRPSLSSDAILDNSDDDDDSDDEDLYGYVSESEVARILDEWSGTEDDIFETASGSGSRSLTLAEIVQLSSSWKRQHSAEDLIEAVERDGHKRRHPSRDDYQRLHNGRDDDDEDDDDEGSSTEVEGDSEYETDDSSGDECTEEESERTRGEPSTADTLEGGATEDSAATATTTSPSSPAVKNAARANFFSAAPTVVRLDHWRMFKKDDKREGGEEGEGSEAGQGGEGEELVQGEGEGPDREEGQAVSREEEGRDTDVSESLEMDSQGEEGARASSLEDLADEELSEEEEEDGEREMSGEGDDFDKAAVSLAMEQLLVDIDQTSVGGASDNAPELDALVPSDNDDNDNNQVFVTGKSQLLEKVVEAEASGNGEGGQSIKGRGGRTPSEDTEESVLRSVKDMQDDEDVGTGEDTLRQVLQDVAAMADLSDSEPSPHQAYAHLDERFITHRKKPGKRARGGGPGEGEGPASDSDLTISTPSESMSSSSSSSGDLNDLAQFNSRFLASGEAEDDAMRPDEDMMRDYMTTMSIALEESFSDGGGGEKEGAASPRNGEDMNRTLQAEEDGGRGADDTNTSSVYLTPEASMEEQVSRESDEVFTDALTPPLKPPTPAVRTVVAKATAVAPQKTKELPRPGPRAAASAPGKATSDKSKKSRASATGEMAAKGARKLPEVPRPKFSASQPQNAKKTVTSGKAAAPSAPGSRLGSTKPGAGRSSSTASSHPPSSSSDSSKQRAASASSRQQTSSSDSSRASVPRALPRPGVAKRVVPMPSERTAAAAKKAGDVSGAGKAKVGASSDSVKGGGGGKTVIPVDKGSLWSDSSTDSEFQKKKIPVDASVRPLPLPHQSSVVSDIEDIPFADESEVDEKFLTPSTSVKAKPAPVAAAAPTETKNNNVRRRLLPSTPNAPGSNPNVLSAEQIQGVKQAELAKARQITDDKKWPGSEGEGPSRAGGVANPTYGTTAAISALKRRPGIRLHDDDPRDRRSSSYDTPGTPDVLSDSDDLTLSQPPQQGQTPATSTTPTTTTPTSSAAEMDGSGGKGKKKKQAKSATASAAKVKMRKSKDFANKRKSEEKVQGSDKEKEEGRKEKNRRSLLAMFLPKGDKARDKTGASDSDLAAQEKVKSPKASSSEEKGKKGGKWRPKRPKSREGLDAGLAADIKGLKITAVFDKGSSQGDAERRLMAANRPLPLAPKASVDEFSDSDESQISIGTLLRRKDQFSTEGLDERVARKLQRVAARQQKRAEQQRLRAAQEIQRRLQEVDERQRELEDRGIAVEKALRGEGPEADVDENQLMGEWFNLVHEKNALVRYESELMVRAKELELEDRQARLQLAFRDCSLKPDTEKSAEEIEEEGHLLDELLDVVEQRNALVAMLEEDRLREQEEDRELETMMVKKGFVLSPLNYSRAHSAAVEMPPSPSASAPT